MHSLQSKPLPTFGIALILAIVYVIVASRYARHGDLNADEGFYCIAAKRATSGEIPYRDFAYAQMPVLPYVNGLAMRIIGFGYHQQRALNVAWGALALIIALNLVYRSTHWPGVIACACVFTLTTNWVYFTCIGKTYALATLFLLVAAAALYREKHNLTQVIIFTVAGVLAIGCRLSVAPAVAIMWILLIIRAHTTKRRYQAVVLPIALMCCLYVPFILASTENFWFWNIQYHTGSKLDRAIGGVLKDTFWLAPGLWVLALTALVSAIVVRKNTPLRGVIVMLAGLCGIATNLVLSSCYGENAIPFFGLIVVGAIEIIAQLPKARWLFIPTVVAVALALFGPQPKLDAKLCRAVENTAQYIESHTRPDDKILTTFPIIAIEANREVIPNCEMGKFCLTTEMDEDRAKRLHLFTPATLLQIVKSCKPDAIVMTAHYTRWSFYWTVPSLLQADLTKMKTVFDAMFDLYDKSLIDNTFLVMTRKMSTD